MILFEWIVAILVLALGIPVAVFVAECCLGLFGRKRGERQSVDVSTAIVMPAHNEEEVIAKTLENLTPQLGDNDSVIVVADNCSDRTADIARGFGVTVVERSSDTERGKGFALDFGIRYLERQEDKPEIVVILDADCMMEDGALGQLKAQVKKTGLSAQACYLMKSDGIDRITIKISEFAFLVKNKIRLRGLARLNMPVPLTGTGMAFPWVAIVNAKLATGEIVEDMRLGVELVEQGRGARYVDDALVYSFFPTNEAAEKTQRERWEHGHMDIIRQFVPRLFRRAVADKNIEAFVMMLDLLVPPLSLLVFILCGGFAIFFFVGLILGQWWQFNLIFDYLMFTLFTVIIVWFLFARSILTVLELAKIPVYMIKKITVYIAYFVKKQTSWIRTGRS